VLWLHGWLTGGSGLQSCAIRTLANQDQCALLLQ